MESLDLRVLGDVLAWCQAGRRVTLVTVVETWGSAPRPPGALLAVRDDGVGFDTSTKPSSAYGLVGMRYRVEAVHGTLEVLSAPGQGTVLRVRLPGLSVASYAA